MALDQWATSAGLSSSLLWPLLVLLAGSSLVHGLKFTGKSFMLGGGPAGVPLLLRPMVVFHSGPRSDTATPALRPLATGRGRLSLFSPNLGFPWYGTLSPCLSLIFPWLPRDLQGSV